MRMVVVAVLFGGLFLGQAQAQTPQFDTAVRASVALRQAAGLGVAPAHSPQPSVLALAPARGRAGRRSIGTTLMLIGAGGIITGAVVGGSGGGVLIVGGAVCAGYGFYLFQQ